MGRKNNFICRTFSWNGLKSLTVRTYLSAIKAILQENNITFNQDQFALNALTRACKLKNDRFITRLPISKEVLRLMMEKIESNYSSQPYIACLYRAMFSTAYYGLLRAGEVAKGSACGASSQRTHRIKQKQNSNNIRNIKNTQKG